MYCTDSPPQAPQTPKKEREKREKGREKRKRKGKRENSKFVSFHQRVVIHFIQQVDLF
jgi:hypothetical protein